MIYLYALIAIASGVLLALKGLSKFRILMSLAVTLANGIMYLSISEFQPEIISTIPAIIIALISGLITYLLARIIIYVWLYYFQMLICIAFLIIFSDPEKLSGGIFMGTLFGIPLLGTILLRNHIKPLIIGLLSGFSIGIGLGSFLTMALIETGDFMSILIYPLALLIIVTIAGVVFQYLYILKKNPELSKI